MSSSPTLEVCTAAFTAVSKATKNVILDDRRAVQIFLSSTRGTHREFEARTEYRFKESTSARVRNRARQILTHIDRIRPLLDRFGKGQMVPTELLFVLRAYVRDWKEEAETALKDQQALTV